jgi:tetratricopeptide (TPR) repeat protein
MNCQTRIGRPFRWLRPPIQWGRGALVGVIRHPFHALLVAGLVCVTCLGLIILGLHLWAGYHFRSARTCVAKYHDAEALEHLQACLRVWPQDPESLLLAARAARRVGRYADAEKFQERYENARGEDDNLTLEGMLLRAERGEVDAVSTFCQILVARDHPDTPLILEAQARAYLAQLRLHDAAACLKKWRNRQPDNPQAYFLQARLDEQTVNPSQAIAHFRRAVELDPAHEEARKRLAAHLLDMSQGAEALRHLDYLLEQQPDDPVLQVLRARCLSQLGQPARAEQILEEVLARDPHQADALALRGNLALQHGQPREAETWLRQAAILKPADFAVHHQLQRALKRNGKDDAARKLQKQLKQMENDMRRIHEIATRQMQANPHNPALHYEVAMIALRAGATEEGVRWLHSALRENPRYRPAHRALALYYRQRGSPGRAAEHLKLAKGPVRTGSDGLEKK